MALDIQRSNSLLPYLQGSSVDAGLRLSLLSAQSSPRNMAYPFEVLDDTPAFSRFITADLLTDAGSTLTRVVLQVQKDRYARPADELHPLNNRDLDAGWRQSFSPAGVRKEGRRLLLSCQMTAEGGLAQLDPLFYCRERNLFFHPVCPSCGLALQLCTDEQLLQRCRLAPYGESLKRYLYCDSCARHGSPEFYVYELDHTDPVTVKDRWALIDAFKLVDRGRDPEGKFPCIGCPQRQVCYGPEPAVRTRIIPFSFYPFHLLIQEAPSLNAVDFLAMVSGAGAQELAGRTDAQLHPGRVARLQGSALAGFPGEPLFTRDDPRFFLELLFLKLTFLSDLLRQYLGRSELEASPLISERVWVRIPAASPLLPACWNFRVELLDEVTPAFAGARLPARADDFHAHLGLFWFQALCQNASLGQQGVLDAVSRWISSRKGEGFSRGDAAPAPILAPENIFWQARDFPLKEEWHRFWTRACLPGSLLLQASAGGGRAISRGELMDAVDELCREIKTAIFAGAPLPELRFQREPAAPQRVHSEDYDGTAETVILTGGLSSIYGVEPVPEVPSEEFPGGARPPKSYPFPLPTLTDAAGERMLETMMAAPGSSAKCGGAQQLKDGSGPGGLEPPASSLREADELAETMFIQPMGGPWPKK